MAENGSSGRDSGEESTVTEPSAHSRQLDVDGRGDGNRDTDRSDERPTTGTEETNTAQDESGPKAESDGWHFGVEALSVAAILFLVGGAISIVADPPPSTDPIPGLASHALWAIGIALLAIGSLSTLRRIDGFDAGLAGYLATGAFGLGALHGLDWVTWAYVDVRASEFGEYDMLLDAVISPYGAGHALVYGILLGAGTAWFAWALRRTSLDGRFVAPTGIAVGAFTVLTAGISLLTAVEGGGDGALLYNVAILAQPVCYTWIALVGLGLRRRRRGSDT